MDYSFDARSVLEPAQRMYEQVAAFTEATVPIYDEKITANWPETIKLDAMPTAMLDEVLADASAHPLIQMAHLSRAGYPFQTVMGFHYMDGKIHVMSRSNAAKIKALKANPNCSFMYHNNVADPARMACITLMGRARIIEDKDYIHRANVNMSRKAFRDHDMAPGGVEAMIATMDAADRIAVVLDEIDGVYLMVPAPAHLPSGLPLPVVSWRRPKG